MEDIFSSSWFRFLALPIIAAVLTVFVKYVSRNDRYARFRKEDLAVGLELSLAAILMFLLITTERALELVTASGSLSDEINSDSVNSVVVSQLQTQVATLSEFMTSVSWIILMMILGVWSMSTAVRKLGWRSERELSLWIGVVAPNFMGIAFLLFSVIVSAT